ncbi:MAG TPA: pitrilysin family protein [Gemmatimonadaceae bacterium]|nr:pitrilysin family protein [Gemmatimonadaceae bacterium]
MKPYYRLLPVLAVAGGSYLSAQTAVPASARVLPPIPYTQFTLPNGLRVIMHEDHSVPIVAVNVWYHVGSKNETPGKTGFAHLFEHMMFQGSKNYDDDFFRPLQTIGGTLNGSTNVDRTNYFEVVPSNYLERALFLEADRMGGLLEALTEAKLANQRDVVKNEKRQNYDNRPYGLVGARIAELLYPASHPYHWLTIGALEDLTAASMTDVKSFFRRFYTPNNASLVIAGDINRALVRALVTKHFGPIPRGPAINRVVAPQPMLEREVRATMHDQVSLPRLHMVWHTVPQFSPDDAALDILASILAGGKSSRLDRALVYDRQTAQVVSANHISRELAGTLQITVTPKRGASLDSIESVLKAEIARLTAAPPTREEVDRAYNVREAGFVYGLQTVQGKSDRMNGYATFRGLPGFFEQDLARYRAVTPADVQRVARRYLADRRLVLTVLPGARDAARPARVAGAADDGSIGSGGVAPPEAPRNAAAAARAEASLPKGTAPPRFSLPQIQRRTLVNGLDVLVVEHHELPVVTLNLVVKSGSASDPAGRAGLANAVASLLDEGTATRSAIDISEQLAAIGAQLSTAAAWDATTLTLTALTRHSDAALRIFSDVLLNPAFADAEVERFRTSRLTALAQRRDDATAISGVVYPAILYGAEHPYGRPSQGDEASTRALSAADVRSFYAANFLPNNATLIVVGDVRPDDVVAKLEQSLAGWKAGVVAPVKVDPPSPRAGSAIYIVDRPGAAQSVINIGHVGVARSSPDYFPLLVLNNLLGGQFMSRVNLNLRENKGYTYGARTSFDYRRGAGPFAATAGVQTAVTRESVAEFLKELRGIRGAIPVTEEELANAKRGLTLGFPRSFETPAQIAARLADVALYGLPPDYFDNYVANIERVTVADISRVANAAIDPSRLAILVVGDRKVIEPALRTFAGLADTITILDSDGRPVVEARAP